MLHRITRLDSSSLPATVTWILAVLTMDKGHNWCAHFRVKILKEYCIEEMDEEEQIEAVRKFPAYGEISSRSYKDYGINVLKGVVYYWDQSAPTTLAVAEL